MYPQSCDTFVVLPPLTHNGLVVFGKNSDRPRHEVQEVIFVNAHCAPTDQKLKCTYISIEDMTGPIHDVILSKPAWMWGAEMGANDKNVVIGNEAVWTNYNDDDGDATQKRLLGMDLVRLGLERGSTAEEALNVITSLLEKYGQGGPCSDHGDDLIYHNSFLIADTKEAWVLETSGKMWAAEKIESGHKNISNGLTIGSKMDKHSNGLHEKARALGLWNGGEFNFTNVFSAGGDDYRLEQGCKLLAKYSKTANFTVKDMFAVLRDKDSGICFDRESSFSTMSSQVSCLSDEVPSVHWFTATPDPSTSFFKPFVFAPNVQISEHTVSPDDKGREHNLYKLQRAHYYKKNNQETTKLLSEMENNHVVRIDMFIQRFQNGETSLEEVKELMKDCVETEIVFYKK